MKLRFWVLTSDNVSNRYHLHGEPGIPLFQHMVVQGCTDASHTYYGALVSEGTGFFCCAACYIEGVQTVLSTATVSLNNAKAVYTGRLISISFSVPVYQPNDVIGVVSCPPPLTTVMEESSVKSFSGSFGQVFRFNPRPVRALLITRTVRGGGPPWRSAPDGCRASRKKTVDAPRRDLAIANNVFSPRSRFDLVRSGERSNFREKYIFWLYTLIAALVCVVAIWNLHQRVPRSILNKIECCYCIPLQYLA